jgi:hypothetical protein
VNSDADGKFSTDVDVTDKVLSDVAAYTAVANDAAAHGRLRDAEVAFLTACRIAGQVAGADSQEAAQAKYELARNYSALVTAVPASPANDPVRADMLRRAELLYTQSMDGFSAKLGQAHEKTRLAAAGLTLTRQSIAMAGQVKAPEVVAAAPAAPASSPASAASAARAATSVMGAAADPDAPRPKKKKPKPVEDDASADGSVAEHHNSSGRGERAERPIAPQRLWESEPSPVTPSTGQASGSASDLVAP